MTAVSDATRLRWRLGTFRLDWRAVVPWASALAGATAAALLGWRGADLPAQLFRFELFRHTGWGLWNLQWYGGHSTPGYSLLSPALGAVLGPVALGIGSALVATACFERLARAHFGPRSVVGTTWFGIGTVANLAIGRLTFALGLAVGMAAVLAADRGHRALAVALGLACPLASPVAGLFLGLAAGAWLLCSSTARDRGYRLLLVTVALVPVALNAVMFPEGGAFPFEAPQLLLVLASGAAVAAAAAARRPLRVGAVLYAALAIVVFVIPTPLGSNVTRLGMFVAGPLLACLLWPGRRALVLIAAPLLLAWQWMPASDAILTAGLDPSTHREYFAGLVDFLRDQHGPPPRVEIPFTLEHWESAYVAPSVPIARGWERQLDVATNPVFYNSRLSAETYHHWLVDDAVTFVALPDVPLDWSATREAAIIRAGQPYLRPVWSDRHWRVWAVVDAKPMVSGPARLVASRYDSIDLAVRRPGTFVVRVRYTDHWGVDGKACVEPTREGWTRVRAQRAGRVALTIALLPDAPCASAS